MTKKDVTDRYVFWRLWRWAARRHPTKTTAWRKRKYFSAAAGKWDFGVRVRHKDGESRVLQIHRLDRTKIERHIKVKGQANPYDPQYTEYFEKRRCFAWRILCGGKPTKSASAT